MRVHYFFKDIKSDPEKRNNWCICVLYGDWPERSLSLKGMASHFRVWGRNCKEGEDLILNKFRMTFFRYYNWDSFINEEMNLLKIDERHPLIIDLNEIKKRYKNIA